MFPLLCYYFDSFTISSYSMSIKQCSVKLVWAIDRIFNNLHNYSSVCFHHLSYFSKWRTHAWPPTNNSLSPLNRYAQMKYIPEKGECFCKLKVDCKVVKTYCKRNIRTNVFHANYCKMQIQCCYCSARLVDTFPSIPCELVSTFV